MEGIVIGDGDTSNMGGEDRDALFPVGRFRQGLGEDLKGRRKRGKERSVGKQSGKSGPRQAETVIKKQTNKEGSKNISKRRRRGGEESEKLRILHASS